MAKKYLDQNGLSYLWGKLKVVFNGKADKVDGATNGNFAGLDANGNLVDSGQNAADFKAVQTAVSDPSADGEGVSFIDSVSQDTNGVITPHKKNVRAASTTESGLMSADDKVKLNTAYSTLDSKINNSEKGVANGVATLDGSGLVPSSQLPSYVDDVIESYPVSGAAELSAGWLAATDGGAAMTPETGKIYVLMADTTSYATNTQFRWGGTAYVKLNDGGVSEITTAEIDTILAS